MDQQVDILLIEDNIFDAELAMRALTKTNLRSKLVHLKNGEEVCDFIFCKGIYSERKNSNTPKVIFLDLKMPKIDGIEVLKILKADERSKKIPVVMLTSSRELLDIETCYNLGANSYIVKPLAYDQFSKAISEVVSYWITLNQAPA